MKRLIVLLPVLLMGCSLICNKHHNADGTYTSSTAYIPAWPWQDSQRTIERMQVSAKTNGTFTSSVRGVTESETTSSNATAMIQAVVTAAINAAINSQIK